MAKSVLKKKKTNRRLRKSVRRTLGALCMMTAIIVAAIPFPDSAAGPGDNPGGSGSGNSGAAVVSEYQYTPNSADDLVIKDVISGVEYTTKDSLTSGYTAYTIYQGSGGRWELDWQFKYYAANKGSDGIITDYNGAYSRNVVELERTVYFDYVYITQEDYSDFLNSTTTQNVDVEIHNYLVDDPTSATGGKVNKVVSVPSFGYVYKLDQDPNLMALDNPVRDFYETKIPQTSALYSEYTKFKEAYSEYTDAGGDTQTPPEGQEPVKKPTALQGRYSDIYTTDAQRQQFLCDEIFGGGTSMKIIPVTFRQYDSNGDPLDENPLDVYVPQVAERPSTGQVGLGSDLYNVDKNNFLARNVGFIGGIAKGAFAEVENVDTLTIADEIDFIGDEAFKDSFIRAVNLPLGAKIGNRAFKGCKYLTEVNMTKGIQKIGTECFSECPVLTSIEIPTSVETIGVAAFYKCDRLANVVVSDSANMEIQNYAFFDCPALSDVQFGTSNISKIGKAAFALTVAETGNLSEFQMPNSLSGPECIGDYLFAGRTSQLKKVIMPVNLGRATSVTLPGNMFDGCNSLQCIEFPSDSCFYVEYPTNIFSDVRYSGFYVRGPKVDPNNNPAKPRQSTWVATFNNGAHVPYVYNENGQDYYEVSDGSYLMVIDEQGILASCQFIKGQEGLINEFVIPAKVGEISVTEIANGCFDTSSTAATGILDYIEKLVIEDGAITKINDEVFKNADKLKEVFIDNSVQNIGSNAFSDSPLLEKVTIGAGITNIGNSAFENCPKLEDIIFIQPDNIVDITIGDNAFSTGGAKLTIEGVIDSNYGPFKWAMNPECFMDPVNGVRVLYKSPSPNSSYVILDNLNNMPTLVDYPRIDNLPNTLDANSTPGSGLRDRYLANGDGGQYTTEERALIDACLNVNVPDGVKSIDAEAYFNNESVPKDGVTVNSGLNNEYSIKAYFYDGGTLDEPYATYKGSSDVPGGLFSSNLGGVGGDFVDGDENELIEEGNDWIRSVTMESVEYLPDNCFYSCENLESVLWSEDMTDCGSVPFELCTDLISVGGSSAYTYENGILYRNNNDGTTKTLVECLASRGTDDGPGVSTISFKNDPLLTQVSEIEPGAFRNCKEIISVDFVNGGTTQFTSIPEECFKGNELLAYAYLPSNVNYIGREAFADTGKSTDVWIYSDKAVLGEDVFGSGTEKVSKPKVTAHEDSGVRQQAKEQGIDVSETIPTDGSITVTFFVRVDGKLIEVGKATGVQPGDSVRKDAPDEVDLEDYIPDGYILTGWEGTEDINNIQQNCFFIATITYKDAIDTDGDGVPDTPSGDNNGNTGNNGNGGNGGNNGGSGGSGSNKDDDDEKNDDKDKDNTKKYTLTVVYGNGSGVYASGSTVIVSAIEPPAGKEFYKWTTTNTGLTITSATSAATTVKTTNSDAVVTATYRDKSTVSGNTINRKPIGNSGSTVQISKPGISNTDKAYASVSGSTDNFIIKITESSEAANAVATALSNKYFDMNPIKYFAMDISLYDKNGNKVTNTNGLAVNVTMPIPDALVQYGGNNKVGAVVNGNVLEELNCKFTTVDGIPCVTFTATHFSPYTIYVDTSNLSVNTLDSTPKTGDGIHPKWFVSIALACISLILFMKRDKVVAPRKITV